LPDWVTHLGTTYLAAQGTSSLVSRLVDIRYILLGALLPDATRFVVILVDILDWPAIPTFTYFIPFHSLLIMSLVSGAVAVLAPASNGSSARAFFLIMAGAAFHFFFEAGRDEVVAILREYYEGLKDRSAQRDDNDHGYIFNELP